MEIQKFSNNDLNCSIGCVVVDNVWFRGKNVATALGYLDTTHAIKNNVEDEDKYKLEELNGGSQIPALTFNEKIQFI